MVPFRPRGCPLRSHNGLNVGATPGVYTGGGDGGGLIQATNSCMCVALFVIPTFFARPPESARLCGVLALDGNLRKIPGGVEEPQLLPSGTGIGRLRDRSPGQVRFGATVALCSLLACISSCSTGGLDVTAPQAGEAVRTAFGSLACLVGVVFERIQHEERLKAVGCM